MADESSPSELTARLAVHPSTMIPGIPRFVFAVPEGWVVDEAPDSLCVVRKPADDDGFWTNVLIRWDRVPRSVDFEQAAKASWAKLLRTSPTAVDRGERLLRVGSRVIYTRGVDLDAPDGRPVAQMQAFLFAPVSGAGKTVDLFQIVGTCPRDATVEATMRDIVSVIVSFRFV